MYKTSSEYKPENFVEAIILENNIAPQLFRKLKNIATSIDSAVEIEEFQAIGVQCREVFIELGNYIYFAEMTGEGEQPRHLILKERRNYLFNFI